MISFKNFKPKLLPTIITAIGLVILISLSIWQFNRLFWKLNLINKIKERVNHYPEVLPAATDLKQMEYRKFLLKGHFLNNMEIHMYGGARRFKGEEGYYVLTPFKLADDNRIIIINRGWVAKNFKMPEQRPQSISNEVQEISGAMMSFEQKPRFVHDNQLDKNVWFYISYDDILKHTNLAVEKFYILAREHDNQTIKGSEVALNIRNDHLVYALTWLFFAITLLIVYLKYHLNESKNYE